MPLDTSVQRDNEVVPMIWDYFTLSAMYCVAIAEGAPETPLESGKTMKQLVDEGGLVDMSNVYIYGLQIDCDLFTKGQQTIENDYSFKVDEDRTVEFKTGDVFTAHRVSK